MFLIPCATLYCRAIVVAIVVLVVGVLHCIVGPTFWLCCYPHAQAILCWGAKGQSFVIEAFKSSNPQNSNLFERYIQHSIFHLVTKNVQNTNSWMKQNLEQKCQHLICWCNIEWDYLCIHLSKMKALSFLKNFFCIFRWQNGKYFSIFNGKIASSFVSSMAEWQVFLYLSMAKWQVADL